MKYKKVHILFKLVILLLFSLPAFSQGVTVTGRLCDSLTSDPFKGANVFLLSVDSTDKLSAVSDKKGYFVFKSIKTGQYNLRVSYIGYDQFNRKIDVKDKNIDLGKINLQQSYIQIENIEITAEAPLGRQNSDTIEINASAYKTKPNDAASELIKKMPGIEIDQNGEIKAHGKIVESILIDGKAYFKNDLAMALKVLPSSVISKIQLFDKKSDKDEFSGRESSEKIKAINIITRSGIDGALLGKFTGGLGYIDKYSGSGIINKFDSLSKVTITASTGVSSFEGLPGRNVNHSAGLNYINTWNIAELTANYNFSYVSSSNMYKIHRENAIADQTAKFYDNKSNSDSKLYNHRLYLKLKWDIDSNNQFQMIPSLNYQKGNSDLNNLSVNHYRDNSLLNSSNQTNKEDKDSYNLHNELMYKHKFDAKDRLLTFSSYADIDADSRNGQLITDIFSADTVYGGSSIIDQMKTARSNNYRIGGEITYTEPIHEKGKLSLAYSYGMIKSRSENLSLTMDTLTNHYDLLETGQSDKSENRLNKHDLELEYSLTLEKVSFFANLKYQISVQTFQKTFPNTRNYKYNYNSILPSLHFKYNVADGKNLIIGYFISTRPPTYQQLSDVINNSNSMYLYSGNPSLKQVYTHNMILQYFNFNKDRNDFLHTSISLGYYQNNIMNSTIIAYKDTVVQDGSKLPAGGSFTRPVYIGSSYNINTFIGYGFPVSSIGSKIDLNIGGFFSSAPATLNRETFYNNNLNIYLYAKISGNLWESLEYMLSARASINASKSRINSGSQFRSFNITNYANIKWTIWEGFYTSMELNNRSYIGSTSIKNNVTMLNTVIGKSLFDNKAEIKFSALDILRQKNNSQTSITNLYTEISSSSIPADYLQLDFIYNLNNM